MYSQAMVSPALMHNLGLPSGLPWLKASHARVIGSLKRAESSPALGCSPGKHRTLLSRLARPQGGKDPNPDCACQPCASQEVKGIKRSVLAA